VTSTTRAADGDAEYAGPVLLAALAAGVLGQGGYAGRSRLVLGVLVAAAALVALFARSTPRTGPRTGPARAWGARGGARPGPAHAVMAALVALAGWAVLDGALHGDAGAGVGPALLGVGVAAALGTGRRLPDSGRDVLVGGLVAVGLLVAAAGWIGVALRVDRWALLGQGIWRASSTLTYPNATAAVLAPLALLVLSRLATTRSMPLALAGTGLLAGLAATGSRGGLLAAAIGLAVLGVLRGPGRTAAAGAGPVLGAAVATAGLVTVVANQGTSFTKGTAFAQGDIFACAQTFCGQETDQTTIQIAR